MKRAQDIMSTTFHTLSPDRPVVEAVKALKQAAAVEKRTIFGMMVLDAEGKLAGILSMYDILLAIHPRHIHIWGEIKDIDLTGLMDTLSQRSRTVLVGDIMSSEVITIAADAHIFMVLEIMNKMHIRRLPVIDAERVVGIIYLSDLFNHILNKLDTVAEP